MRTNYADAHVNPSVHEHKQSCSLQVVNIQDQAVIFFCLRYCTFAQFLLPRRLMAAVH